MINNIFQAKYEVSKLRSFRGFANAEKLVSTYMKTGLLVYPHQIVAALAAMEDPLRKGFILADEVGLGKGIEAMLVVSQHYHDGKKICIIVPSPLEAMWRELIQTKFGLQCTTLNAQRTMEDENINNPSLSVEHCALNTDENAVTLVTYPQAVERAEELKAAQFDFVVFEEAHRLRKFHTGENKTASTLHEIFKDTQKLLLTATPIVRHVMDIYGLIDFIDKGALGDADTFYKRYYKKPENYPELKEILAQYIFRTLRRQVKADINLPERNILTYSYTLESKQERELYAMLTRYLGKKDKVAFPDMDSYELTLMLEKLFASSIAAFSKTISNIVARLKSLGNTAAQSEIDELQTIVNLADSIKDTSKGKAFIKALTTAMRGLKANEMAKKCLIFTENTETQKYIVALIKKHTKYKVAAFSGATSNAPMESFHGKANILVSTDNGAEGFDFTHCNLVINFDNLWLASAIEQRIGRVHRIGQQNDVVVINFLNPQILADVRFYELAFKRLNMVGGILGATDEVVSDISSGEIEKRISEIMAATRNARQTEADYKAVTAGLEDEIEETRTTSNDALFRTFDAEIAKRTQNYIDIIIKKSAELKDKLWDITRFYLGSSGAHFYTDDGKRHFSLRRSLYKSGNYTVSPYYIDFDKDTPQWARFSLHNKIAREILGQIDIRRIKGKGRITFDGMGSPHIGKSGTAAMITLHVTNFTDYTFIVAAFLIGYDHNGTEYDESTLRGIFDLPSTHASESMSEREFESDRRFDEIKAAAVARGTAAIKASFGGVIENGIKRIKAQLERERFGLKVDIDNAEREVARLAKAADKAHDEFLANQQVVEATRRLNALKESEFIAKAKLKKAEAERTAAFLEKFQFSVSTTVDFVVDFSVTTAT